METNYTQLTPKQQLFCDEYLTDMNATRAALRAGYSEATALNGALMRLPKIQWHLEQRAKDMKQKVPVSPEMLLAELSKIAFGNMGNYLEADGRLKPLNAISDDDKAALWHFKTNNDGTVNLKMHNKLAAIEKIARLLRFYEAKVAVPQPTYVYLDKKDICADDRFEDSTIDAPELPFEEPIEFCDTEGNTLYDGPIPYGPRADIFVFDMHDKPADMLTKLSFYENLQPAIVGHAATNGVGEVFEGTDIRLQLSSWLEKELAECGCLMRGEEMVEIYHKFRMLRLMRKKGGDAVRKAA